MNWGSRIRVPIILAMPLLEAFAQQFLETKPHSSM
jgi:hypothetical protein